jgi:hypothetical protein
MISLPPVPCKISLLFSLTTIVAVYWALVLLPPVVVASADRRSRGDQIPPMIATKAMIPVASISVAKSIDTEIWGRSVCCCSLLLLLSLFLLLFLPTSRSRLSSFLIIASTISPHCYKYCIASIVQKVNVKPMPEYLSIFFWPIQARIKSTTGSIS